MRLVAEWRDRDGMSWDAISDALENHIAVAEGRKPLSRAFRRGTTKKTAWRMYRAHKQLEQGEPVVSHRRCRDCRRSLPLAEFTATGRECYRCRITRPLRKFEQRVGATSADFIGKCRVDDGPRPSSLAEVQHRVNRLVRDLERLAKQGSNAELLETILSFTRALSRDLPVDMPVEGMSQGRLELKLQRQIKQALRPVLLAAQAEAAMQESNGLTQETEDNL